LTRLTTAVGGRFAVQSGLKADGVFAEDEGVHLVMERDGDIAEFADRSCGLDGGHADLHYVPPNAPMLEVTYTCPALMLAVHG